jgi:hypothetical protein
MLRKVAARYGVSQSEIMNNAPFLFIVYAEKSLTLRAHELEMAKTLAEQAQRSIGGMPHHLNLGVASDAIEAAVKLEEESINQRQIHGPDDATIWKFTQRDTPSLGDPFRNTVIAALEEVGARSTADLYRSLFEEDDDFDSYDSFLDEDEGSRLSRVLDDLKIEIDDLVPASSEHLGQGESDDEALHETPASGHQWRIVARGDALTGRTGANALEALLRWLHANEKEGFRRISEVHGRTRPLIARSREALYPGRPDLAGYSREFAPGWFVGTNYSRKDVKRLMRAASEAAGLAWGVDVFVSTEKRPHQ